MILHNIDLEKKILGQLIYEEKSIVSVIDILLAEYFYDDLHKAIFNVIVTLFNSDSNVDMITVSNQLMKENKGEMINLAYISSLTSDVIYTTNLSNHILILKQFYIRRHLLKLGNVIANKANNISEDVANIIEFLETDLLKLSEKLFKKDSQHIKTLVPETLSMIEMRGTDGADTEVSTGLATLDKMTKWKTPNLIVLAARPGMGKTALMLSMLYAAAKSGKAAGIFSLEMSSHELTERLINQESSDVKSWKIKSGQLDSEDWQVVEASAEKISTTNLIIDDTPSLSITEFRAKARRMVLKYNVKVIAVDYLQLMTTNDKKAFNREQEVSLISRQLKAVAKELEIPIIALSQLSRANEQRAGDKRPQLSDLRESGAIEQNADIVIFIHRPDYYGITEDGEGNNTEGLAEIIYAKHRNGSVGDVYLRFVGEKTTFEELEDISQIQNWLDD